MSILIKDFSIINGGDSISLNVETDVGYFITSIGLWKMNDFKDYAKVINLDSYITGINNKEVIIVNAADVGVDKFVDILFTEIKSNAPSPTACLTCSYPAIGITYNLSPYYNCLISYLLDLDITLCRDCDNKNSKEMVITINMLIDSIPKALDVGYYTQAIDMVNKLTKLCSIRACKGCPEVYCATCKNFIQSI